MRNLKKFLALVMAMVMAFSLMLSASAANPVKTFDDAGSIEEKFVEAADVLTGMKVFQGDEGGFRPADTITRAEVAALIYRLATGDVDNARAQLYANYGNFTDVAESDWFAGYVGYCANAGYIKGTSPTTFDPYGQVTGYETLAMILRAIGYDKNGEFTGATWQTNVSALATQLGILENIKTTHYGDTLYLASRRDVVAELLFQADAKVPMVTYTTAFGYQNTGMEGGVVGSKTNPTLGLYIFGLTNDTGVIVGNQETGERVTILGRAGSKEYTGINGTTLQTGMKATWSDYNYPGTPVVDGASVAVNGAAGAAGTNDIKVDNSLFLDYKSGIDVFGYKTKFWYNGGENDGTKMGTSDSPRKVYASFDKHEKDEIVWAADDDLAGTGVVGTNTQSLGPVAKDNDFAVGSTALFNTAFDRMYASRYVTKAGATATNAEIKTATKIGSDGTDSPVDVYKIISNQKNVDGEPVLDLVVELNIQSSKISGVDNVSPFKYVTVPDFDDATTPEFLADANIYTSNNLDTGFIAQKALVGDSTKTLGANEIGWHITGTTSVNGYDLTATTLQYGGRRNIGSAEDAALVALTGGTTAQFSTAYYKLAAVGTKEGVVTSYHNHTADVPGSGWVILNDGTRLNQSVLYNTVQDDAANGLFTIPQQGTADVANEQEYGSMTYRFYLDAEGNYVGAEPIVGTEFVYGTYIDFESNLGTSTYTYRLVGVGMDGKMVTHDVSRYSTTTFQTNATTAIGATGAELDAIGIPFRGDSTYAGTSVTGVRPGKYLGFAVNGNGVLNKDIDNTSAANLATPMMGAQNAANPATAATNIFNAAGGFNSNTMRARDAAIGAFQISDDADGDGTKNDSLYVTEATKFVIVSGTGTDTQRTQVFNGVSELLGSNSTVTFNFGTKVNTAGSPAYFNVPSATTTYGEMVVWSQSDFIYAQDNTGTAKQADVIFLPAEAVSGVGSQLYYVGNNSGLLTNAYGRDATKFTMYMDGEKGEYWVIGLVGTAETGAYAGRDADTVATAANSDRFYTLTDTGLKANDGEPIYAVDMQTNAATGDPYNATTGRSEAGYIIEQRYTATTKDSQTATIGGVAPIAALSPLYKVTGAKVVNLNADNKTSATSCVWPGITDLATLNEASSLNNVTGNGTRPLVSCVVSADGLTVTTIYVCWNQTP